MADHLYLYGRSGKTRHIADEVPEEGERYPIYSLCDHRLGYGTLEWFYDEIENDILLDDDIRRQRLRDVKKAPVCNLCLNKLPE